MAVSENPTTWFEDITEAIGKFEPVLLECVRRELEGMASRQNRRARLARVALELGKTFQTSPCGAARVDDEISSAALRTGAWVATTDSDLSRTLGPLRVEVIGLRSGRVWVKK